jgi:hypothetical protein
MKSGMIPNAFWDSETARSELDDRESVAVAPQFVGAGCANDPRANDDDMMRRALHDLLHAREPRAGGDRLGGARAELTICIRGENPVQCDMRQFLCCQRITFYLCAHMRLPHNRNHVDYQLFP